jgi:hypothetical protein
MIWYSSATRSCQWAPDECEFYKWRYKSARKGNYDIYVVFVERCLELLAPDGLLGFIMPHKFWQAKYGEGLRRIIADGRHLRSVIDFADQQVFGGVTTYTAVQIFSRQRVPDGVDYSKVVELEDGRAQCGDLDSGRIPEGTLRFRSRPPNDSQPWVFTNAKVAQWLDAVRGNHPTLGQLSLKIAQGLVSGCDDAFYLERRGKSFYSNLTRRSHEIEAALIHPLLKGSVHMRRWLPDSSTLVALFPYERAGNVLKLIKPRTLAKEYPAADAYLRECRAALEQREKRRFAGEEYYQYSRRQNFEVMDRPKILVPAMAQRAEYSADLSGEHFYVGSGGGGGGGHAIVPKPRIDMCYLTGVLNSATLDSFLQWVTTPFHSGWYAYSKAYVAQIPIKLPETAEEKKLAERIIESVHTIMDAKVKLRAAKLSDRERRDLAGTVESNERRIDEIVCRLYGVKEVPGT